MEEADEDDNPDIRMSAIQREQRVEPEGELAGRNDNDSDQGHPGSHTTATLPSRRSTRLQKVRGCGGNATKPATETEPESRSESESESECEPEPKHQTETRRTPGSVSGTMQKSAAAKPASQPALRKRMERKRGRRGSKRTGSKRITYGGKEFGPGCKECKRRHILCGRQRPACSFCLKMNLAINCTYAGPMPEVSKKRKRELENAAAMVVMGWKPRSAPVAGLAAPETDSVNRESTVSEDPALVTAVELSDS